MQKLFIYGMIRSGTTLLDRILNSHSEILSFFEPFKSVYNCIEYYIAKESGIEKLEHSSHGDYFANGKKKELHNVLGKANLNIPIPESAKEGIIAGLKRASVYGIPGVVKHAEKNGIKGETGKQIFEYLWNSAVELYSNGNEKVICNKEIWAIPFIPVIKNTYPDSKFIIIYRDPRAVLVSKNKHPKGRKVSWIYLARMWRELSIITWLFKNDTHLKNSIYVLSYEELIMNKKMKLQEICNFIGVDFDERMLDEKNYVNIKGDPWFQNSVYLDNSKEFTDKLVHRWQKKIEENQLEVIEQLCHYEMKMLGYCLFGSGYKGISESILLSPPIIERDDLDGWYLKEYGAESSLEVTNYLLKEKFRYELLNFPDSLIKAVSSEILDSYFVDRKYFHYLRAILHH